MRDWGIRVTMRRSFLRPVLLAAVLCVTLGGAHSPAALTPAPKELATLEPGAWALKDRETGSDVRRICLGDTRQLLQLRHRNNQCVRFVVTDAAGQVVVTNDCAAAGNERTDIRIETPRLIQVQSQGIADGAPFSAMYEGRRVGVCR